MLNQQQKQEVKRVGRFGIVGILNTLIDVSLLNLLKFKFGLGVPYPANLISTSAAMIFSFFANREMVFASHRRSVAKQAALFLLVTAFGLYVLQTGVLKFFGEVWTGPVELAVQITRWLQLDGILSADFVRLNSAKAAAIAVSMVWNYNMYKRVVFKK